MNRLEGVEAVQIVANSLLANSLSFYAEKYSNPALAGLCRSLCFMKILRQGVEWSKCDAIYISFVS